MTVEEIFEKINRFEVNKIQVCCKDCNKEGELLYFFTSSGEQGYKSPWDNFMEEHEGHTILVNSVEILDQKTCENRKIVLNEIMRLHK